MPTWGELKEYVKGKYKLAKEQDDWFSMVFNFDNQRSQLIIVRRFEAFSQEFIEISSRICKEDEMSPKVALKKNCGFAVGFIGMDDQGYYIFMHRAALKLMDPEEFELPLGAVMRTADELEKTYAGDDKH